MENKLLFLGPVLLAFLLFFTFGCAGSKPETIYYDATIQPPPPPKSESDCDNRTDSKYGKRACLIDLAKIKEDPSICEKIVTDDPFDRAYCYIVFAEWKKDVSHCVVINDSIYKDDCIGIVAGATKDASLCSKINSPGIQERCFTELAILNEDASICDYINISYAVRGKDPCLTYVALLKNQESMCDQLHYSDWKNFCYKQLSKARKDTILCTTTFSVAVKQKLKAWCSE
ncbi:MAG: hypothetical protein N3G22_04730 [Candidatus Micrarchaeota archaeon]|nr:hypothetical protein [Candidatus Micrarchaeota archaeon]